MSEIVLNVLGTPASKGSARAIMRGGRALVIPGGSGKNLKTMRTWDASVREVAAEAVAGATVPPFVDVPLRVEVMFRLARPKGHWGKTGLRRSAPAFPATKPDIDKLARSTCDALRGTIYDDDSRIVMLNLGKEYAGPGTEGATIRIAPMDELG